METSPRGLCQYLYGVSPMSMHIPRISMRRLGGGNADLCRACPGKGSVNPRALGPGVGSLLSPQSSVLWSSVTSDGLL